MINGVLYRRGYTLPFLRCLDEDDADYVLREVHEGVSGKHALFQMDSWHVAQSLHVPAALFEDIRQLSISETPVPSNFVIFSDDQNSDTVASQNSIAVDRQFSINLFAAYCRLLYTLLKHQKR